MSAETIYIWLNDLFSAWGEAGRATSLIVQGRSMVPLIKPGDRVSIRSIEPQALRCGDIIAFEQNGTVVVHRLITKRRRSGAWQLCQKGDNLAGWSWVGEKRLIGRVESIHRAEGSRRMLIRPWKWINPFIGVLGSARIILAWSLKGFINGVLRYHNIQRERISPWKTQEKKRNCR